MGRGCVHCHNQRYRLCVNDSHGYVFSSISSLKSRYIIQVHPLRIFGHPKLIFVKQNHWSHAGSFPTLMMSLFQPTSPSPPNTRVQKWAPLPHTHLVSVMSFVSDSRELWPHHLWGCHPEPSPSSSPGLLWHPLPHLPNPHLPFPNLQTEHF